MSRVILSVYDDIDNLHYAGGGARVVLEVARGLAREHDVTVYCSSFRGSPRRTNRDGVEYRYLPSGWAGPRGGQVIFSAMLPFVALSKQFDVWLETFTPPWGVSLLPFVNRRAVVGWAQLLPGRAMSARYGLPFWWLERLGLRWYRTMVVLNEADRDTVLTANPRLRVIVIPNGVDPAPVDVPSSLPGEPFALYLGRIDVRTKGLDLLVEAQLRAQNPLPLVIAGSGTAREEAALRKLVPRDNSIRLVGHVDGEEKERLLRDCAALILPSRVETFGLVALEAMARGTGVIAFDLPTLNWLRGSGHTAVTPFDTAALADAMDDLADSRSPATNGETWKAFARRFDWDSTVRGYLQLISETAGPSSRSSAPRDGVPRHA